MKKQGKNGVHASYVPSFRGLQPASEGASLAKRANRKQDSRHEVMLRRELTRLGLRYRKYVAALPGNPDLTFSKARVVVFCDGDFWHGRNWARLRRNLSRRHNAAYWIAKIARNRERDRRISRELTRAGWKVLRIWETDILRDPVGVAYSIQALVRQRLLEVDSCQGSERGTAARNRPLA
ncbi:MAG: very short patch repair endonuclease [Planctomycetes bacterium]|nr:very short patch repair endonuclease [Planctomycetota bacterium]